MLHAVWPQFHGVLTFFDGLKRNTPPPPDHHHRGRGQKTEGIGRVLQGGAGWRGETMSMFRRRCGSFFAGWMDSGQRKLAAKAGRRNQCSAP